MIIIIIISLLCFVYSLSILFLELCYYFKEDHDDYHERKFISININLLVLGVGFMGWLFTHKGINHAIYVHLIKQQIWVGVLLFSYLVFQIAMYSKRVRLTHKKI